MIAIALVFVADIFHAAARALERVAGEQPVVDVIGNGHAVPHELLKGGES